ncbi:MAG: DUF4349 domain-containing protein [bacterium]|nr:DUF4349 domain-containing protein [bacterium]
MRKGIVMSVLAGLAVMVVLGGCGSKAADYYLEEAAPAEEPMYDYATDDVYTSESYDMDGAENTAAVAEDSSSESVSVADNRKLIRNVDMSVETENMKEMLQNINDRIAEYGGYAEYASVDAGYANIKARIPSDKLDTFVSNVAEMSNVTNKTESAEDITLQYVDTKSRVESLQIEQDRLNELLAEADSVDTVIALESRLSEVRYELQSYESQLRTYDNLVDYSTVQININEVKTYAPQVEATRWEKMTRGFVDSMYGVGEGFLDFIVGLIIALPFLIVWALIIFVIFLIIRAIIKSNKKKQAQRLEQQRQYMMQNQQQQQVQNPQRQVQQQQQAQNQQPRQETK